MNVRCLARISGISHDGWVARSARAVARDPRQWLIAALVATDPLRLGRHIAVRRTGIADDLRDACHATRERSHELRFQNDRHGRTGAAA